MRIGRWQLVAMVFGATVGMADGALAGYAVPYVVTGDPSPVPGAVFDSNIFNSTGRVAISDSGRIAFVTSVEPPSGRHLEGIFISDGPGRTSVVALEGDADPSGGGAFGGFDDPALSPDGYTAFEGYTTEAGLYRGSPDGSLTRLVREGDPAPDGNGTFLDIETPPMVSQGGAVAFAARFNGTAGGSADNRGLYRYDDSHGLIRIARQGQVLSNGVDVLSYLDAGGYFDNVSLNANGQVAFQAHVSTPSVGGAQAIFLGDCSGLTEIIRGSATQSIPDGSAKFNNFDEASLNDLGQAAFSASLTDRLNDLGGYGYYRGDGSAGELVEIARVGKPAPGGGTYTGGIDNVTPLINNLGQVAYYAQVDTDGNGGADARGFYLWSDDAGAVEVMRQGQPVPDGDGTFTQDNVYTVISDFDLNDLGQVAFIASVSPEAGGTEDGLYVFDPVAGLEKAVRVGDDFIGSTITHLHFGGNFTTGDGWSGINDSGQIAFGFALADGRSGVAVYNPGDALPGDYNASGRVEQGDLDLVLQNWGVDTDTTGVPSGWVNDLPFGLIEQAELDGVLNHWGSAAAPDFRNSSLPEPASTGLLGAAGLVVLRRRGTLRVTR